MGARLAYCEGCHPTGLEFYLAQLSNKQKLIRADLLPCPRPVRSKTTQGRAEGAPTEFVATALVSLGSTFLEQRLSTRSKRAAVPRPGVLFKKSANSMARRLCLFDFATRTWKRTTQRTTPLPSRGLGPGGTGRSKCIKYSQTHILLSWKHTANKRGALKPF